LALLGGLAISLLLYLYHDIDHRIASNTSEQYLLDAFSLCRVVTEIGNCQKSIIENPSFQPVFSRHCRFELSLEATSAV
jgi:hypothetical protein